MVSVLEGRDALTDVDNHAGGFVPQDKGRRVGNLTRGGGQIAVANAAGRDLDGDFIPLGTFHRDGFHLNRLPPFPADDGFCLSVHAFPLLVPPSSKESILLTPISYRPASNHLEQASSTLATADAHGDHHVFRPTALALDQGVACLAGTGNTKWVADGN